MDFDKLYDNFLHDLLFEMLLNRLEFSNRYKRVELNKEDRKVRIRWFGTDEDKDGDIDFIERAIPYNFKNIYEEIGRQANKINRKV